MKKKLVRVVALLWISLAMVSSGFAAEAKGGQGTYEKLCRSCHGPDGKGNPAMTKVFGEKALNIATKETGTKKDDDLLKAVTEGKGKMPAVGKSLSKKEQKELLDHMRSLIK